MTPIVPGIPPATLRTHPTWSSSSTRNTLRNLHPNSKKPNMSTTATVDTNEGWTFAGCSRTSEFPITTSADTEQTELPTSEPNNDWGIAATTTDGWGAPPAAPSHGCPPQDSPVPTTTYPCTGRPATMTTATPTTRARTTTTIRAEAAAAKRQTATARSHTLTNYSK